MTGTPATRPAVDILLVSLGTTFGLRTADDQLADLLRAEGLTVEVARPQDIPEVRTLALTDLVQARACRRAAKEALRRVQPRAVIYASTTAALLWPRRGAIRFDALAQRTRPGRHGPWQRPLERLRLRQASLLLPWSASSLEGAPQRLAPTIPVPVALEPDPDAARLVADAQAAAILDGALSGDERAVAITYAADPEKKGLARTVAAFSAARQPHDVLLVAGLDALPASVAGEPGVIPVGRLERAVFRALIRATSMLIMAPRREDYGLVQLEALAEGARVVTTAAPGPYAALPVIRELWPDQVVGSEPSVAELATAIRSALETPDDAAQRRRAAAAVEPWAPTGVRRAIRERVMPALLGPAERPVRR